MATETQMMPAQAIVRDRDTWMDGDSGFALLRQTDS